MKTIIKPPVFISVKLTSGAWISVNKACIVYCLTEKNVTKIFIVHGIYFTVLHSPAELCIKIMDRDFYLITNFYLINTLCFVEVFYNDCLGIIYFEHVAKIVVTKRQLTKFFKYLTKVLSYKIIRPKEIIEIAENTGNTEYLCQKYRQGNTHLNILSCGRKPVA